MGAVSRLFMPDKWAKFVKICPFSFIFMKNNDFFIKNSDIFVKIMTFLSKIIKKE